MNTQFHRNLVINDDFGVSMAVLNYSGVLLASRAEEREENDYEEDDLDDDLLGGDAEKRKKSKPQHQPSTTHARLQPDLIAIGSAANVTEQNIYPSISKKKR